MYVYRRESEEHGHFTSIAANVLLPRHGVAFPALSASEKRPRATMEAAKAPTPQFASR